MTVLSQRRGKWKHRGVDAKAAEEVWRTAKVCGICGRTRDVGKRDFDIDHNHQTGQVRGMLCRRCNMKVDWFITYKTAAETYLKED